MKTNLCDRTHRTTTAARGTPKRAVLSIAAALALALAACGGGGGSSGSGASLSSFFGGGGGGGGNVAAVTTMSGSVMLGAASNVTVDIYSLSPTGQPGTHVAGPFQTNAQGQWSGGSFPAGAGPWLAVAHGGSFVDEATGQTVSLAGVSVESVLVPGLGHIAITPLSQALVDRMRYFIGQGHTAATALALARNDFVDNLWFDPVNTAPVDPALMASAPGANGDLIYAAMLGGLSDIVANNPSLTAFNGANPALVQLAIAHDFADLTLDGLDANGAAVTVNGQALPALGNGTLVNAARTYASNRTGGTIQSFWGLSFAPDPGTQVLGTLDLSGSGVAYIGGTRFVAKLSTVNQGHYTWESNSTGNHSPIVVSVITGLGSMVYVGYRPQRFYGTGYAWSVFNNNGVTIDQANRTVTFNNVSLPTQGFGNNGTLVLNGTLRY